MPTNTSTNALLPEVPPTNAEIKAGYVDATGIHPGLYGRPLVLDRIFKLLVAMIDVLQKTAAAQANRLNFLSQWQKSYTDEMNQIHAFVSQNGDGSAMRTSTIHLSHSDGGRNVDDSSAEGTNARTEMNTLNTNFTQQMQGNRQVIADDAKALQTSVNQTNDAVQAQTDMATSILQQLSTILTSIYSNAG